jgi:uncharacterized YccA/Bax inhibitor family protein
MFVGSVSCLLWSLSVASPHTGQVGSRCLLAVFLVYCGFSTHWPGREPMCIVSVSCLLWSQFGFSTHWPGRESMFVGSVSCLLWSQSVACPHTGEVGSRCLLAVFLVYCGLCLWLLHTLAR